MEWIATLQGEVVGLDTTPLIYLIEENPTYLETIRPFFLAMDRGAFRVVTSTVTLPEVLVRPGLTSSPPAPPGECPLSAPPPARRA